MNDKSHVSLEQHVCLVCGKAFDTGTILLDKRLRASMEHHTKTGWGLCPEHQKLADDGFVALVECDPQRSGSPGGRLKPEQAYRTGRLAHLSPRLMADYRADAVTLDQLMALAITDDHAAQEAAFYDAPQWQRHPSHLRERLTEREIDAYRHPLVRFVGLDTYEAAGGGIRRDLFAEGDAGVYLTDAALLERLAQTRLAGIAANVRAEGWAWVDATPGATHADLHTFQRAPRERREPNKREAARIEKLQARMHELAEAVDAALDADDEEKADALQEEGEAVGEQLQALEDGLQDYGANVKAAAGAIVTIDRNGEAVIHRGLMREAEAKALRTLERIRQGFGGEGEAANDEEGEDGDDDRQPKAAAMSDRLAQKLSAHRTAALQIEVARHPQAALAAVVHGMVQTVLQGSHYGHDLPLGVSLKVQDRLEGMAPDLPESPAAVALRELQQVAGEALPEDSAELFAVLLAKPQDELVRLLAVCVASTVDVVTPRATPHQRGAELAQAVGLDMAAWWKPTAEGYFKHVSKAVILDAVAVFAPDSVTRLAKLKKADIASEAERLALAPGLEDGMAYLYATRACATPCTRYRTLAAELDALSAATVATPAAAARSRPTPAAVLELHTLQALDATLSGASLREVAEGLFGADAVAADWHKDSALRARVRRLVRRGDALMRGGYRRLAQLPPPLQ